MAIHFVCSSCQSKHACADHMAGRQFKCGGCGKILEVPPASQTEGGAPPVPRRPRPPADADYAADLRHDEDRGGMPVWMQVTLMVLGGIVAVVLLLVCLGGLPFFLWTVDAPPPPAGVPVEVKEPPPAVEPPPVVEPLKPTKKE